MSIHVAESAIAVVVKINTKSERMSELLYMKKGDFNESFTIIGYSLAVITTQGKYTFRFMGDKLQVYQLMEKYAKQN
jgi:hypothetical protein